MERCAAQGSLFLERGTDAKSIEHSFLKQRIVPGLFGVVDSLSKNPDILFEYLRSELKYSGNKEREALQQASFLRFMVANLSLTLLETWARPL